MPSGVKPKKRSKPSTTVVPVADVAAPAADDDVEEKYLPKPRKERSDKGQARMKIRRLKKEEGVRKV